MIEITSGSENLLVATAHAEVTAEDYEQVLGPAIRAAVKEHQKIRFLYQLDDDFLEFTGKAMWRDAKLRLRYLKAFEAVAVVTNVRRIVNAAEFFSFFMACPVKVFTNEQLADAKDWVATATAGVWMTGA